jgi:prevent-host-death family protein
MIAKLRDAKEQLSELVKRAAGGEEIIITVRGQPMARLSAAKPVITGGDGHRAWAQELAKNAKSARRGALRTTPQSAWDELRGER